MKQIITIFTLFSFVFYMIGCNSGTKYLHTVLMEEVKPDKFYKPCAVKFKNDKKVLLEEKSIMISNSGSDIRGVSKDNQILNFKLSNAKGIYTKKDSLGNCGEFLRSKKFKKKYLKHKYIYELFDIDSAITVNNEKLVFKSKKNKEGIGKLDFDNNELKGFNYLSNEYVVISLDSLKSIDLMREDPFKFNMMIVAVIVAALVGLIIANTVEVKRL